MTVHLLRNIVCDYRGKRTNNARRKRKTEDGHFTFEVLSSVDGTSDGLVILSLVVDRVSFTSYLGTTYLYPPLLS